METPLALLRKYFINDKKIINENGKVYLENNYSYPEDIKTNFHIYGSGKNDTPKDFYTLKTIIFFLKNLQCQHSKYVRDAASKSIVAVRRPDRKNLLAYLRGEISTCESLDKFAEPEILTQHPHVDGVSIAFKRPIERVASEDALSTKKARLEAEKLRTQLAAKLSGGTRETNCVSVDQLKSLSELMTADKIADIKAKRLAMKRTTIQGCDVPEAEPDAELFFFLDPETKAILARERNYRNRVNLLQSAGGKEFAKDVLAILQGLSQREQPRPQLAAVAPRKARHGRHLRAGAGYCRYEQEKFGTQQQETAGNFNIDAYGSYHGVNLQTVANDGNKKCPVQPVIKTGQNVHRKRTSTIPIILVPSSNLSLITTLNATEILQDMKFANNAQKQSSGVKKQNDFLIQRRKPGGSVPYRVMDNPLKLSPEDWQRVVAVFVVGPTWQFKGWPIGNGNPVNIFSKISAFHIKYSDMKLDANVEGWNVHTINISRTGRHQDRAALMQFWEILDREVSKRNAHLRL